MIPNQNNSPTFPLGLLYSRLRRLLLRLLLCLQLHLLPVLLFLLLLLFLPLLSLSDLLLHQPDQRPHFVKGSLGHGHVIHAGKLSLKKTGQERLQRV